MSDMKATEVIQTISQLERERQQLVDSHKRAISEIDGQLEKLKKMRKLNAAGLDIAKIQIAERVIYVKGSVADVRRGRDGHGATVRAKAVEDAIRAIAESEHALKDGYIGVKNYDAFGDQRTDCPYGMGPRHGGIVFSIGRASGRGPLTEDHREAAIYYLDNLAAIQAKSQEAA